jgi:hypothetical protein
VNSLNKNPERVKIFLLQHDKSGYQPSHPYRLLYDIVPLDRFVELVYNRIETSPAIMKNNALLSSQSEAKTTSSFGSSRRSEHVSAKAKAVLGVKDEEEMNANDAKLASSYPAEEKTSGSSPHITRGGGEAKGSDSKSSKEVVATITEDGTSTSSTVHSIDAKDYEDIAGGDIELSEILYDGLDPADASAISPSYDLQMLNFVVKIIYMMCCQK